MKISIVEGYGGSYESYTEWQIKAFFSKERAEAYAARIRAGTLADRKYTEYYRHIGEEPSYRVYSLSIGDKASR